MIAVDTNLLVYAHRTDSPFHERAVSCLASLAEGRGSWGIPWSCLHEFVSTATHPKVFNPPTNAAVAIAAVQAWMASPTLQVLHEGSEHWRLVSELILSGKIVGPRVHDARIAAICIGNGVRELWTVDRDFNRFPSLTVRNPLIG